MPRYGRRVPRHAARWRAGLVAPAGPPAARVTFRSEAESAAQPVTERAVTYSPSLASSSAMKTWYWSVCTVEAKPGIEPDLRAPLHQRAEPDILEPALRTVQSAVGSVGQGDDRDLEARRD